MTDGPWTEEHVRTILTNPIYVGLGPVPAIMDADKFASVGAKLVKDEGVRQYLGCIYDNVCDVEEWTGKMSLGNREEFITKHAAKLRGAINVKRGIKAMLTDFQARLSPS